MPRFGQIEAGGSSTVEIEHKFDAPGSYLIRATVDANADELPRDNESYCVVTVREALRTLIVDGDPGRERFAGESGYLLTALASELNSTQQDLARPIREAAITHFFEKRSGSARRRFCSLLSQCIDRR